MTIGKNIYFFGFPSGSKKELVDLIEKLRGVIVYKNRD
jgi:hypothetical protein